MNYKTELDYYIDIVLIMCIYIYVCVCVCVCVCVFCVKIFFFKGLLHIDPRPSCQLRDAPV